ncbi:LPS export ABC transporter ATP-binding protein [[Pseudomonas] carboxydohydrogena]|uniref:LPS export ABC transporter ATP-binding protein n=1 Tax=Afipia carboxydohydrogena TaxID=290 RepID=UPI0023AF25EF|nr:LPS export ABC transporter ATP-binding protein [[Pseudomonas] carboxydohydrogena]
MVDLLRMFRRRAPSRGKQGFGRAKGDIKSDIKGDITSFSARMGDMFKGGKSDPAPQPASRQPFQLTEQQQQWASYSEMAVMLTEDDVTSFERTSPPIPRGDARRPPQPESRQAQQRQPQQRPPQQGRAAAQRSQPRAGYLAVHGIEKSFGTRKVVRGINIYVRRGEAVGLLGPNGAGKTTAFYMITGLIKADKGRIELDGYDVTNLPMYQRARLGIGYLPQEASIFRGLSVEDNIRAVLEVAEPDRRKREYELDSLLEEFNIVRLRKSPSIALSGGERRRVEIARALATKPNYMLLDEPFAGIDPIAVGDIQQLVRHLTNRGIGVLITDHNVRETLGLTDRAYIVYAGEVLTEGQPEEIVNDPDVRRLYLGEEFRL